MFRFVKNRGTSKSETRLTQEGKKDERNKKDIRINDSGWNADDYCDSGFDNRCINSYQVSRFHLSTNSQHLYGHNICVNLSLHRFAALVLVEEIKTREERC
jgi:hypothetical protein